ncbi:MAG: D-alanyl-D-alanine carboxypeptidase/D-alanyl-D-alanine-endopeptidase [Phycisphaerales bacterium]
MTRSTLAVAIASLSCLTTLSPAQPLNQTVRSLITSQKVGEAKISVAIIEADSGRTLAAINADAPMIPASNMKVLTSAAALAVLGPDFVFSTELAIDGPRLVIRGAGDPALADPVLLREMKSSVEEVLTSWVNAVKASNPGSLTEIVIDDRIFDREYVHPSWPREQLNRWYCAEVSGLTFHTNTIAIYPRPTSPESAPALSIEPRADWLNIQNRAVTKNSGQNTTWAARPDDSNRITVYGNVRWAPQEPVEVTIHEPQLFLGRLLSDRLAKAGLPALPVRLAEDRDAAGAGRVVAVVRTPIDIVMRRCNVNSHNLYAEALIKRVGRQVTGQPGSWQNGAAVLRMLVQERLGPADAATLAVADGSGMSRDNRVTANLLTRWLSSVASDPKIGPAFLESLPVAAKDGSLKRRFDGKPFSLDVRAKTGYIRSVASLSGFVSEATENADPASQPRRLVFSIIVNDFGKVPLSSIRKFQDEVVRAAHQRLEKTLEDGSAMGG